MENMLSVMLMPLMGPNACASMAGGTDAPELSQMQGRMVTTNTVPVDEPRVWRCECPPLLVVAHPCQHSFHHLLVPKRRSGRRDPRDHDRPGASELAHGLKEHAKIVGKTVLEVPSRWGKGHGRGSGGLGGVWLMTRGAWCAVRGVRAGEERQLRHEN